MPNRNTFSVKPISAFLARHLKECWTIADPFSRNATWGNVTNDMDTTTNAIHHLPAEEFVLKLGRGTFDAVLFDPPYSPRQMAEVYSKVGLHNHGQNAKLYAEVRAGLDRALRPGGIALSFGWNSAGFGKKYGYERLEILLVCHGGAHNDTICVAERKPA
jgi:hypothetical protein